MFGLGFCSVALVLRGLLWSGFEASLLAAVSERLCLLAFLLYLVVFLLDLSKFRLRSSDVALMLIASVLAPTFLASSSNTRNIRALL